MSVWRRPERGLLDREEERAIVAAIARAEERTSAEIRVHIDARCEGEPLEEAAFWFDRLGMRGTADRGGVLIYVAADDRKLAVFADTGVHGRVDSDTWAAIRDGLVARFRDDRFADGIAEAIATLGSTLARTMPRRADDRNELPDDISFGRA